MIFKRHSRITAADVAEALLSLEADLTPGADDLAKQALLPALLASPSEPQASLAFPALFMLAFSHVARSKSLRVPPSALAEIEGRLRQSLGNRVAARCPGCFSDVQPSQVLECHHKAFKREWNESIEENKQPSPHWYVSKRVYFLLTSPDTPPDPMVLAKISIVFVSYTAAIRHLLVSLQGSLAAER